MAAVTALAVHRVRDGIVTATGTRAEPAEASTPVEVRARVRAQLASLLTRLDLPVPGRGRSRARFEALAQASRQSLGVGRLVEAHADGMAILSDAGAGDVDALGLLGVWASDRAGAVRIVIDEVGVACLVGVKPFCSGATVLDHALVTARTADGVQLCLVDLADRGVHVEASDWVGPGMRSTETRTVRFDGAPCVPVGPVGWYLTRPGFWHGATGVAASWFGGALGIVDAVLAGVDERDPHQVALLGDVEATRFALESCLQRAADEIDRAPDDVSGARIRALRTRRIVAEGCLRIIRDAGDALGPRALAFDEAHAQRVVDLEVYVRQDHGRHDSEALGRAVLEAGG